MERRPSRTPRGSAVFGLCAVLMVVAGCSKAAPPPPDSVSSSSERGPIKLRVEASPTQVWIAEPVTIALRVETPAGYAIQFPATDATLKDLNPKIAPPDEPRPTADGGLAWRQVIMVESLSAGEIEIPPLSVKYARKMPDASQPAFENELTAEPLKIQVRSALTSQDSITSPRDIVGALAPPPRKLTPLEWSLIAAGVVLLGVAGYLVFRWLGRQRIHRAPRIIPEIWALQALTDLEREDRIAAGRIREYYYRLTEVVRSYIELKFTLRAPEMTTEEFLTTLVRNRSALPYDAERLRAFLTACDLVKYAAHRPTREDADDALRTARAFINSTAAAALQAELRAGSAGAGEAEGKAA